MRTFGTFLCATRTGFIIGLGLSQREESRVQIRSHVGGGTHDCIEQF